MKKIVVMGLMLLISINMVACGDKSIAQINDVKISKEEYEKTATLLYATGYVEKKNGKDVNDDVLTFMIDNELAYQQAQKDGIKVTDSEVNEKLSNVEDLLNNSAYKEQLKSQGVNENFIKENVKKDLIISKYKDKFIKDIVVKDSEMKEYYKSHKDEFNEEQVKASQILISTLDENDKEVSKEEKDKLKEKAQKLLDRVKNNEDFAKLAKENSDDKNSGKRGGDLGYFAKSDKNIQFTKPVFKLDKNQVSDLIETPYGYHIVKVTDKKTVTKILDDSKDYIKERILNEKYLQHIDSLYKSGKITIT